MGAKIDFKWNKPVPSVVKAVTGGDATLKFMAQAWHRLYTPWVPMASGMLANNVDYLVEGENGIIHHKVPYARRLYNGAGFNFRRDQHGLAQAQWNKGAIGAGRGNMLAKEVDAFIKRGG